MASPGNHSRPTVQKTRPKNLVNKVYSRGLRRKKKTREKRKTNLRARMGVKTAVKKRKKTGKKTRIR